MKPPSQDNICISGQRLIRLTDGAMGNHCQVQRPWQKTSVATDGMGADLFWQYGDTISTGKSHDDSFTIFYGDSDWKCLVDDHVSAIG